MATVALMNLLPAAALLEERREKSLPQNVYEALDWTGAKREG